MFTCLYTVENTSWSAFAQPPVHTKHKAWPKQLWSFVRLRDSIVRLANNERTLFYTWRAFDNGKLANGNVLPYIEAIKKYEA
jgi:hypothetical protein